MTHMRINLPFLSSELTRHGKRVLFVRRNGKRIRMREQPGTTAFNRAYEAAVESLSTPANKTSERIPSALGTFGWLALTYFSSKADFLKLDPISQRRRKSVIEGCLLEPLTPTDSTPMACCPINRISSHHVQVLRDRVADRPGAANNRKKYLSAMFGWAVEAKHMSSNPARDAKRISYATDGFHTWTVDEVKQYETKHPIGTKARLAIALLLYLGVRRSDVILLGRQQVRDGLLHT